MGLCCFKLPKMSIRETELTQEIKQIRIQVFHHEQAFPLEDEFDDLDPISIHFAYYLDGKPVGTCRLVPGNSTHHSIEEPTKLTDNTIKVDQKEASLGRLCVLAQNRHQKIGSALVKFVIDYCRKLNYTKLILNAQLQSLEFYKRLGFQSMGIQFREAHCLHEILYLDL